MKSLFTIVFLILITTSIKAAALEPEKSFYLWNTTSTKDQGYTISTLITTLESHQERQDQRAK